MTRSIRWSLPEGLTASEVTPLRVRDLIIECFFSAQHETFERSRKQVGAARLDEASLRASVVTGVRLAFKESGGDYDAPTARSLGEVVQVLARKSEAWGTPPDVIQHHAGQISKLLSLLGAPPPGPT